MGHPSLPSLIKRPYNTSVAEHPPLDLDKRQPSLSPIDDESSDKWVNLLTTDRLVGF